MNLKDKVLLIFWCAVAVAATNLMTMPQAYAEEIEKEDYAGQEFCIPMLQQIAEREYIERLEKLVSALYTFKIQSNINIAEVAYRERHSTER